MVASKMNKYVMGLVVLVLCTVLVSAVANPVDVKVIGSSSPSSDTFDVTVSLNPKDQAVIGMDLYLTSSDGSVVFSNGKSSGLWLKGAMPLANTAESNGAVWHFVIPSGIVFDKTNVDKNVFTVTAKASKNSGTIKVDAKSGVSIFKQGTATITPTNLDFTVSASKACIPKTKSDCGSILCGTIPDGCIATVSCGNCAGGQSCSPAGACVKDSPLPSGDKEGDNICSEIKAKTKSDVTGKGKLSALAKKLKAYFISKP